TAAGEAVEPLPAGGIEGVVEGERSADEKDGDGGEESDPDDRSDDEEGDVHPALAVLDDVEGLHAEIGRRIHPRVEFPEAEEDRDDEEEEEGKGGGRDLGDAPQGPEPARAGGVSGHQHEKRAHGDADEIEP